MMPDSSVDNELKERIACGWLEQKFAGNPGQVMFVIRDGGETTTFHPIAAEQRGRLAGAARTGCRGTSAYRFPER